MTSVPSDSPDDFANLRDLKTKAKLREEYGLQESWVDFEVVPIIETPKYGTLSAGTVLAVCRIGSCNGV